MNLTEKQKESILPISTDLERLNRILSKHMAMKKKLDQDEKHYYDEEEDLRIVEQYYCGIDFEDDQILVSMEKLLKETHTNQVGYDPSDYVYPWVDLRPDGSLKSIYSGENRKPEDVIKEDYEATLKRIDKINKMDTVQKVGWDKVLEIANEFPYNCEHVVPQSWFNEQQPMRGDIHHLFTCNPDCNSIRSNYPYHDFSDYNPQFTEVQRVEDTCGKANDGLFEPEYGKGTAARAMLYFMIRYPDEIEQSHKETIDTVLLLEWHQQFPPELYEKHRNQAIYEIQGNRNPFIDFPQYADKILR